MLSSYEFEYDLAARKVYLMEKELVNYDDDEALENEHVWVRKAYNLMHQSRTRLLLLRNLDIDRSTHPTGSPERKDVDKKHDQLRGELLLRCSKISAYWERMMARDAENAERDRYQIRTKYR